MKKLLLALLFVLATTVTAEFGCSSNSDCYSMGFTVCSNGQCSFAA